MPGLGEAKFVISNGALLTLLSGKAYTQDPELFAEVARFHRWVQGHAPGSTLMDIRSQSEGKSGFIVTFAGLDCPPVYEMPSTLRKQKWSADDSKLQHQQEHQLE